MRSLPKRRLGQRRLVAGIVLLICMFPASVQGIAQDGFLQAIPVIITGFAIASGLTWSGKKDYDQKKLVTRSSAHSSETTSLAARLSREGYRGRKTLYVMDVHRKAVRELAMRQATSPDAGVYVGYGIIAPEPKNQYDPGAIRVLVEGKAVGYFSFEWKNYVRHALGEVKGTLYVPVLLRWRNGDARVWFFDSLQTAEEFEDYILGDDSR